MNLTWTDRDKLIPIAAAMAAPADSVLDIGPGIRPQQVVRTRTHICVEPFLPYIQRVQAERAGKSYVFLNSTWDVAMKLLPDRSIDTVTALDVIEHMDKEDGVRFLSEARRVARRQVIIFTPLGFVRQPEAADQIDRWGMRGGYWQAHRSGWLPEDFGPDCRVVGCRDFHTRDHDPTLTEPIGAIWAFYDISGIGVVPAPLPARRGFKSTLRSVTPPVLYAFLSRLRHKSP